MIAVQLMIFGNFELISEIFDVRTR